MNINLLNLKSKFLRQKIFRAFIEKKEAHLGGCFSMIEILISIYEIILGKNDKFILSKSHASFALILLLREKGLNPKLTTHLEIDEKNGIYCTTGSLGHGLPIATGMAFAKKIQKENGKIFVLISDGECQEGTTWESLLIASKHQLDNLIILIDYNKIQALTRLDEGLPLHNLRKKIIAFNCNCYDIKNGHSFREIIKKLTTIKKNSRPNVFIFNTVKGKGIKEFENDPAWHARKLSEKDIIIGKKRLEL
jgi:transketolase